MRKMLTLVFFVVIAAATAHGQEPAAPQVHVDQSGTSARLSSQTCNAALSQAHKLITTFEVGFLNVNEFRTLGDAGVVSVFASNLKSDADSARHLSDRLLACSIVEGQKQDKNASELADEFSTFATALSDITEFGNMYNWTPPDGDAFPSDLATVAPACGPILASHLPQRIEKLLAPPNSTPPDSGVSNLSDEADPSPGAGLATCAAQAYNAGYVGAAWRLLSDEGLVTATMRLISTRQTLSILRTLGSPSAGTIRIENGPRFCTGTVENWGWQKTIDWSCF
ncbi:MAG TPA: hypothetical protein VGS20_07500 [Candidatus Acidoferrales bacterium]|nr:hypothetical protein [Candidatus Acidoferrales bacterium]